MTDSREVRERFRRLGIDVWVRRGQGAAAAAEEAPPAVPDRRAEAPPPRETARTERPAPAAAPAPEPFSIHCFRLGRVFVAADEGAWRRRRYLLDVARAMNGFAAAERSSMRFDWPQPGVSASSRAERAFSAFLDGQMTPGMRALIAGARAAALAGMDAGASRAIPRGLYLNPADESADARKALWALIVALADD